MVRRVVARALTFGPDDQANHDGDQGEDGEDGADDPENGNRLGGDVAKLLVIGGNHSPIPKGSLWIDLTCS